MKVSEAVRENTLAEHTSLSRCRLARKRFGWQDRGGEQSKSLLATIDADMQDLPPLLVCMAYEKGFGMHLPSMRS